MQKNLHFMQGRQRLKGSKAVTMQGFHTKRLQKCSLGVASPILQRELRTPILTLVSGLLQNNL